MERCANINEHGRRRRLVMAIVGLTLALGIVWLQMTLALRQELRLLAIVPLLFATYGFFQVREQTCIRLARSGQRETDRGLEPIEDPAELYRVRRQASVVHASAILSALALAFFLYAL